MTYSAREKYLSFVFNDWVSLNIKELFYRYYNIDDTFFKEFLQCNNINALSDYIIDNTISSQNRYIISKLSLIWCSLKILMKKESVTLCELFDLELQINEISLFIIYFCLDHFMTKDDTFKNINTILQLSYLGKIPALIDYKNHYMNQIYIIILNNLTPLMQKILSHEYYKNQRNDQNQRNEFIDASHNQAIEGKPSKTQILSDKIQKPIFDVKNFQDFLVVYINELSNNNLSNIDPNFQQPYYENLSIQTMKQFNLFLDAMRNIIQLVYSANKENVTIQYMSDNNTKQMVYNIRTLFSELLGFKSDIIQIKEYLDQKSTFLNRYFISQLAFVFSALKISQHAHVDTLGATKFVFNIYNSIIMQFCLNCLKQDEKFNKALSGKQLKYIVTISSLQEDDYYKNKAIELTKQDLQLILNNLNSNHLVLIIQLEIQKEEPIIELKDDNDLKIPKFNFEDFKVFITEYATNMQRLLGTNNSSEIVTKYFENFQQICLSVFQKFNNILKNNIISLSYSATNQQITIIASRRTLDYNIERKIQQTMNINETFFKEFFECQNISNSYKIDNTTNGIHKHIIEQLVVIWYSLKLSTILDNQSFTANNIKNLKFNQYNSLIIHFCLTYLMKNDDAFKQIFSNAQLLYLRQTPAIQDDNYYLQKGQQKTLEDFNKYKRLTHQFNKEEFISFINQYMTKMPQFLLENNTDIQDRGFIDQFCNNTTNHILNNFINFNKLLQNNIILIKYSIKRQQITIESKLQTGVRQKGKDTYSKIQQIMNINETFFKEFFEYHDINQLILNGYTINNTKTIFNRHIIEQLVVIWYSLKLLKLSNSGNIQNDEIPVLDINKNHNAIIIHFCLTYLKQNDAIFKQIFSNEHLLYLRQMPAIQDDNYYLQKETTQILKDFYCYQNLYKKGNYSIK
jgi:hypothetical protein